jgi:hypothetical protein
MSGLFARGTMGLGTLTVSGRKRVPNPPAIITALVVIVVSRDSGTTHTFCGVK